MSNKKGNSQLIAVGSVIIIALLAIIGWLAYSKAEQGKQLDLQKTQMAEAEQVKVELEKEYYEALTDLEELRGSNTDLNALIEDQKTELKKQKDQIAALIGNKRDLAVAREEITKLRESADNYLAELNRLKDENEVLAAKNELLQQEKEVLTEEVQKEREMNDELLTVKAALMEEKDELSKEAETLNKKVTMASVVKATNLEVEGLRLRSNGKEGANKKAKNIDILKICFAANENRVTDQEMESFFVRLINPAGETMAVEELGSGTITTNADEEIRYTSVHEIPYNGDEVTSCLRWQPELAFQPGTYEVEIYNKGHLSGKGSFTLK